MTSPTWRRGATIPRPWPGRTKSIAMGYRNNKFGPSDPVTREQLAAILYRYAQYKGMDVSAKGELSGFTDAGKASAYAREPLGWAVGQGHLERQGRRHPRSKRTGHPR